MAMMVHLTDEFTAEKILRSGIKGRKWHWQGHVLVRTKAIFCMPVLPDFYTSHQWLRELKRRTTKKLVGVYFRIPDDEMVLFGRFDSKHRQLSICQAIQSLRESPDAMGYEIILPRYVAITEIHKIRALPQTIGWRYLPDSHQRRWVCDCDWCIGGSINAKRRRAYVQRVREKERAVQR